MKRLIYVMAEVVAAAGVAWPVLAAEIEPGEWEFTSVTTSQLLQGPQNATFRRCIKKEEAANPDRWMSDPGGQGDCKLIPGPKTRDTEAYSWRMECPKANLRGTGTARMTRATMEGETIMNGEVQGRKFEVRTKVTGKRLGACKS